MGPKHLKQIIYYTLPTLMGRVLGFLMLPLYARYLTLAEFGIVALLTIISRLLWQLFHLEWKSAYARFFSAPDVNNSNLDRTTVIFRLAVLTAILLPVLLIGSDTIAAILVDDQKLSLAFLAVILQHIFQEINVLFTTRYRLLDKAKHFALIYTSISLVRYAGIFYLLVIQQMGVTGIFIGRMLPEVLASPILLLVDNRWLRQGRFDKNLMIRCLKYGLPLIPGAIAMFLMAAGDRYMLKWLLNTPEILATIGIYAMAFRFVKFVQMLTIGFIHFFDPYVFKTFRRSDAPEHFAMIFRTYSSVLFTGATTLCMLLPWLVDLLFPLYQDSLPFVPLMLCGFIILNIGGYFCIGIGIAEKNMLRALWGSIASVGNIIFNLMMIPFWGALGAAISTIISYLILTGMLMYHSQKFYPVPYAWSTWIFPITSLLPGYFIMHHIPNYFFAYGLSCIATQAILYFKAGFWKVPTITENNDRTPHA